MFYGRPNASGKLFLKHVERAVVLSGLPSLHWCSHIGNPSHVFLYLEKCGSQGRFPATPLYLRSILIISFPFATS
mgnify:CR=1 FL=1